MSGYWVAMVDVTDPIRYEEYIKLAPIAISRFGGKVLARGGRRVAFEGAHVASRVAIIEFPSIEHAQDFYGSSEYQEARQHRLGAGDVQALLVVEGVS